MKSYGIWVKSVAFPLCRIINFKQIEETENTITLLSEYGYIECKVNKDVIANIIKFNGTLNDSDCIYFKEKEN